MIACLRGTVEYCDGSMLILNVHGVGYQLQITTTALQQISEKTEVQVYTYLQVKDDGLALYGFASLEEKQLFEKIITVSGAGPKTALALLSALPPKRFRQVIAQGDTKSLTKVSGVGKKTAERLILELKDSLGKVEVSWDGEQQEMPIPAGGILQDALEALVALGYTRSEAESMTNAALEIVGETHDLQALLKVALASTSGKKGDKSWKKNA